MNEMLSDSLENSIKRQNSDVPYVRQCCILTRFHYAEKQLQ